MSSPKRDGKNTFILGIEQVFPSIYKFTYGSQLFRPANTVQTAFPIKVAEVTF